MSETGTSIAPGVDEVSPRLTTASVFRTTNNIGSARSENARQDIVHLVVAIFWLLVVEGGLRKWAFPQYANILYFVRDPVVVACYWIALRRRLFKLNYLYITLMLLGVLVLPIMIVQAAVDGTSAVVLLYGWHNYFFYVPLAFLIATVLKEKDVGTVMRHAMWMSIPISVLVYIQFRSPPSSAINRNVVDGGWVFRISEDIVRTTGTFSFTLGQSFFIGCLLAIVTADWIATPAKRVASRPLLIMSTISTMTMLVFSGSRTAFGFAATVLFAAILSTFLAAEGKRRFRTLAISVIPIFAGLWLLLWVFPEVYDLMTQRQEVAVSQEGSTIARGFRQFTDFTTVIQSAPSIGYGLGYGTGAGSTLLTGQAQFTLAEDEWSRIVLEAGPVFGITYVALRVMLALLLVRVAVSSAARRRDSRALVFLGFTLPLVLTAPITMQVTANGFCWIFVGLTLAAADVGAGGRRMSRAPE